MTTPQSLPPTNAAPNPNLLALPHASDTLAGTASRAASETYFVHLSEGWCVEVDTTGAVIGSCAEGALGYIVQLVSARHVIPQRRTALKIPRLRADTLEENAYVCEILSGEAKAVFLANGGPRRDGLVRTSVVDAPYFLRRPRALKHHPDPLAREQDGCTPLVHFGKDHRVRICNVRFDLCDNQPVLRVFPETMTREMAAFLRYADWLRCEQESAVAGWDPPAFYFIGRPSSAGSLSLGGGHSGSLVRALDPERPENVWYMHLPSMLFEWADGTLQRALSTGAHITWDLKQHYKLLLQVLCGLETLHRRGIIHADLRPANVMAIGDLKTSEHYALSDYGSFTNDQANAGGGGPGYTTLPGITRHRASIFYARERRAGVEREDADVALIIGEPRSEHRSGEYFVRLGWKADFMDADTNQVHPDVLADMETAWGGMRERDKSRTGDPAAPTPVDQTWRLAAGDQIRLRDYVFKLIESRDTSREIKVGAQMRTVRCLDFRCEPNYTRVLLEKLAVRGERYLFADSPSATPRSPEAVLALDLPRWVELRQSSVATDLYSVGVLALYTVYTCARLRAARGEETQQASTDTLPPRWDSIDDIEERIAALVRRLEDDKNFGELWPLLSVACGKLESAVASYRTVAELLSQSDDLPSTTDEQKKPSSFKEMVENLVVTVCHLSEELRTIQEYINNCGFFLLFLHMVLSCIHRRSHLAERRGVVGELRGARAELEPDAGPFPFCADRFEAALDGQVARLVIRRLHTLINYFEQMAFFREFHSALKPDTQGVHTTQSEVRSWQELRWLKDEHSKIDRELKEYKSRSKQLDAVREENGRLRADLDRLKATLDRQKAALEAQLAEQSEEKVKLAAAFDQQTAELKRQLEDYQRRTMQVQRSLRDEHQLRNQIWLLLVEVESLTKKSYLGKLSADQYERIEDLRREVSRISNGS